MIHKKIKDIEEVLDIKAYKKAKQKPSKLIPWEQAKKELGKKTILFSL